MKPLSALIALAAILWFAMFSPLTAHHLNFWWAMAFSAGTLATCSSLIQRRWIRSIRLTTADALLGMGIAAVLWACFWVGDKVSALLFDFARPQVDAIYGMKDGQSPWLVGALLLFLIGPAEELFWRGYVQRTLSARWSPNAGFALTSLLYAAVHASSCNFMLTMAALVAGVAWGLLYRLFPTRFGAILLSHALWDVAVFILFPI